MQVKRPRSNMDDDADSPVSKRSISEEPAARTPQHPDAVSSDELSSEAAQLDKMDIAPPAAAPATSARARPSASEQRTLVKPSHNPPPGPIYVVKRSWYRAWCDAVDAKGEPMVGMEELPPIDNEGLVDDEGRFLETPKPSQNVVLLEAEHYNLLSTWYGENAPGVQRRIITTATDTFGRPDFYPPVFHLCRVTANRPGPDDEMPTATVQLSLTDSVAVLKAYCRSHLRLSSDSATRYWIYGLGGAKGQPRTSEQARLDAAPYYLAQDLAKEDADECKEMGDSTLLVDAGFDDPDVYIAVEQQDDENNWLFDADETEDEESQSQPQVEPARPNFGGGFFSSKETTLQPRYKSGNTPAPVASTSTASEKTRIATRSQTQTSSRVKGLVGLSNMGNTCFMNSALQCLSNTPELRDYILADVWRDELNEDNPLGMQGQVATAFAALVHALWAGGSSSAYLPRDFKAMIGKFRPMFIGWSQQDSQELIAFLLDGLHEDLNRIIKKPYTEIPDWEGEPTPERMYKHAALIWDLYRRRNDSVMIDLFFGQFRSTLTCLECGKVSYKFDEFSSVTLNLPKKPYHGEFFVIPLDPRRPRIKVKAELPVDASIRDAKLHVGKVVGLDGNRFIAADAYEKRVWKFWADADPVSKLQSNDLVWMFEAPFEYRQSTPPRVNKREITIAQRDEKAGHIVLQACHVAQIGAITSLKTASSEEFGKPLVLSFKPEEATTYEAIYDAIVHRLCRDTLNARSMFILPDEDNSTGEEKPAAATTPDGHTPFLPPPNAVPRRDLFRILVSATTSTAPAADCSVKVGLEKRIAERARAQRPEQPIPGAFPIKPDEPHDVTPIETNGDAMAVDGASPEAAPPATPVIATGDMLNLEWTSAARKTFFDDALERFESFEAVEDPVIKQQEASRKSRTLSLDTCLADFCKPERLGEDNPWKCPVCDKLQENTTKQLDLWKVPDVLVIHLKRFSKSGYSWSKMDEMVDFPLENWDLTNWVEGRRVADQLKQTEGGRALLGDDFEDQPLLYDLFAVDNHYGAMGGGHYTAYAKNTNDGHWHHFDDSHVSLVSNPESVRTKAAYLLFYRRQTKRSLGGRTNDLVASAMQSRSVSQAGSESAAAAAPPAPSSPSGGYLPPTPPDSDDPPLYERISIKGGPSENPWGRRASLSGSNDADIGSDTEPIREPPSFEKWTSIEPGAMSEDDDDLPDAADAARQWVEAGRRRSPSHRRARSAEFDEKWSTGEQAIVKRRAGDDGDIIFVDPPAGQQDGDDVVHEIRDLAEPVAPDGDYVRVDKPAGSV